MPPLVKMAWEMQLLVMGVVPKSAVPLVRHGNVADHIPLEGSARPYCNGRPHQNKERPTDLSSMPRLRSVRARSKRTRVARNNGFISARNS
jgi:hypothetical protein